MSITYQEWLTYNRKRIRKDWDNPILFSGIERSGKSRLMLRVFGDLVPGFSIAQVHFTLEDFLVGARSEPPYGASVWDEARFNRRAAMTRERREFTDFMQVSGGLNLNLGFCFPHDAHMDDQIRNWRVKWNLNIPQRGLAELRKRVKVAKFGDDEPVFRWSTLATWRVRDYTGPLLQSYLAKKQAHMRQDSPLAKRMNTDLMGEVLRRWKKDDASGVASDVL